MREDYESAGADSASVSGAGYIAPPLALLRLREAGVVRLCGLAAASRGLDLAARHALSQVRREGARLSALVGVDTPIVAWFEVISADPTLEALTLAATRWGCAAHAPDAAGATGTPGCEHVAAILSAWVRAPGDFRTPTISTISTAPTPTTPPVLPTPIAPVAPTAPESPPTSSASTRTHQPLGVFFF